MSTQQPPKHNLEQYKKQAKDLLKAHQAADAAATALVREHLPRLQSAADQPNEITLQEAQHVIARQHQCKDWNWLRAVSTLDLEPLIGCTHRELATLMRESDGKDLLFILSQVSAALKNRFMGCMSKRMRAFLLEDMSLLEPLSPQQIEASQQRIMLQANRLAMQNQFTWPDGKQKPTSEREDQSSAAAPPPRLVALAAQPLDEMHIDEIAELWRAMADHAKREGILALDEIDASPFVSEALGLMIDGTEPDLIEDILATRSQYALRIGRDTRSKMVIEALMAIQSDDNPRLVHHKLTTFYIDFNAPTADATPIPRQRPPQAIQASLDERLSQKSLADMDYDEIAALFTDMAYLRRQVGPQALGPYAQKTDHPLLHVGLQQLAAEEPPQKIMETLEALLAEELQATKARHRATITGVLAVQEGEDPREVERLVREAYANKAL